MAENLGFLTVIDQQKTGLIGGYLVLNPAGRPLEFHCTVPVLPDKIQEILYGETLQPFLYGERIAQTLLKRSKIPIFAAFTNNAAVLPVQNSTEVPVIYVFDQKREHHVSAVVNQSLHEFGITHDTPALARAEMPETLKLPPLAGFDTAVWQETQIGNRWIAVPNKSESLVNELTQLARTIDFAEPFVRIRAAVEEAQKAA
ncbi:MAG: hypothetical protein LBT89_03505 [Planctomycetaceae bacterium]|jgi:hypothetical protein|nr:hypothetical protein [Planctomycetaceae bacterium]